MSAAAKKPGRPEMQPDKRRDYTVSVRLTRAEMLKWENLGGAEWLRKALARARA